MQLTTADTELYCGLMEEIKKRQQVVDHLRQSALGIPQIAVYEMCYLQLRKICELIGLGCLVAHGDIPRTRRPEFTKLYHAGVIIRELEALHPAFYPVPGTQVLDPISAKVVRIVPVTEPYLTKPELTRLYAECGEVLHRGTLEALLKRAEDPLDFSKIDAWGQKIVTLLNHHQIQLIDKDLQIWVLMHEKEDGMVHTTVFAVVGSQHDPSQPNQPRSAPSHGKPSRAARRRSREGR